MRPNTEIYKWKIKKGAYAYMSAILNFPETVDYRIDEKICRIIVTSYTIKENIKKIYHNELLQDHLLQVKIKGVDDKEFLILQSQLIEIEDFIF